MVIRREESNVCNKSRHSCFFGLSDIDSKLKIPDHDSQSVWIYRRNMEDETRSMYSKMNFQIILTYVGLREKA